MTGPPNLMERSAPADPAPSPTNGIEMPCTVTCDGVQATTSTHRTNRIWRLRWRRSTWSRSTTSKVKLFQYEKPALYFAAGLVAEGFSVEITSARHGLWHPEEVVADPAPPARRPGCEACDGTGVFLAQIEALARPCPCCKKVAS